jgi:hypothetical protein
MDADRPTLRALLWCPATALQHLPRTMAIACVLCLVAEHHSNAVSINITLLEYSIECSIRQRWAVLQPIRYPTPLMVTIDLIPSFFRR